MNTQSINNPELSQSIGPSMKVVAWEHTPENAEAAANAVQDCAVVAIELAGFSTDAQRAIYNEAATALVSSETPSDERFGAESYIRRFNAPHITALLQSLEGTNKRIVTIDANKDAPDLKEGQKSQRLVLRTLRKVHRLPISKTKELLHRSAQGYAHSNKEREPRVVDQLKDLAAEYEAQDVNIGVLVGYNHTPVFHELAKTYPSERRYVYRPYDGQQPRERLYFSPHERMRRHYRFLPGVPMPEGVVNRAVLHFIQNAADKKGVGVGDPDRARQLENLTDAEVSEIVLAVDGVTSRVRTRLQPKRTLDKMDATIKAKLAEIQHRGAS